MGYRTVQRSWWSLPLGVFAVTTWAIAATVPVPPVAVVLNVGLGAMFALLAVVFSSLRIADEEDQLRVAFGPGEWIPLVIRYSEIREVTTSRLSLTEGWGLKYSPLSGWIYSVHGFGCVRVTMHNGRKFVVGTPDPVGLCEWVLRRRDEVG